MPGINVLRIVQVLGGKSTGPDKFLCRYPAHNDQNPSLSIDVKNGKILFNCHAGYSQAAVLNALKSRGLWPERHQKSDTNLPAGIFLRWDGRVYKSHWTYRNSQGSTTGYVVRYENPQNPKDKVVIPFFKRNGSKWKVGAHTEPRPLYGLDLLGKADKNATVWIPEGEKCMDVLTRYGRLAVTSPGGSKAASKADWTPLAGRTVKIWPDHDGPGQK